VPGRLPFTLPVHHRWVATPTLKEYSSIFHLWRFDRTYTVQVFLESSLRPSDTSKMSAPGSINLDSMSLEELNQLKQQEESRLQALMGRFQQLRAAAVRLSASVTAVSEITPASEGKEVMVPLTESVYVPGLIREPNKLLVEIGTGFYVEKSSKETTGFLDRKLKLVDANSDNITKAVAATRQNVESISMAMQGKMLEIRARQEGQRVQSTADAP
jgi:prefoldin alpha subunit